MKSSRMRTVQLNVCDSEDVNRAVDYMTSTLKDTETGRWCQGSLHSVPW